MPISSETANTHIAYWSSRLATSRFPFTEKWPKYIFRHDPIENAAKILSSGSILSRNQSEGTRVLDVAEKDIIQNNVDVHALVRMYFRPRNPTQYSIEGIRKTSEYYNGHAHAPTLCMMVFDAKNVLTADGVHFSSCNMQRNDVQVGNDDQFFNSEIDFEKVYHFGAFSENGHSIIGARCAEVLIPSPFVVLPALKYIYCRSEAEREYLLYLIGRNASEWRQRIIVSDDLKVFEKKFAYVESVSLVNEGVVVRFFPRSDRQQISIKVRVENLRNHKVAVEFYRETMEAVPPTARAWLFRGELSEGPHFVSIEIENCVAFQAVLNYTESPF